jgi:hypothetical protein
MQPTCNASKGAMCIIENNNNGVRLTATACPGYLVIRSVKARLNTVQQSLLVAKIIRARIERNENINQEGSSTLYRFEP